MTENKDLSSVGGGKRRALATLAIIFVWASCQGGGCSGCSCLEPIPGGFPLSQTVDNAIQVRLTESGLDAIEEGGPVLAEQLVGDLSFPIPQTCDIVDLAGLVTADLCCCGGGSNCGCEATATIESLSLSTVPASTLRIDDLRVSLSTNDLPLDVPGGNCDVYIDTSNGSSPDVGFSADIVFGVDGSSGRTKLSLENTQISDFESQDITLDYDFFDVTCAALDVALFLEDLLGLFTPLIVDQLTGPIEDAIDALCASCDAETTCPDQSICTGGVCMEDSGAGCVQTLGMEGRMDVASALGGILPGVDARVDFLAWMGGYAEADTSGISLGLLGGSRSVEANDCVPTRAPPKMTAIPRSDVLSGNTVDIGGGESFTFDLGVGIDKSFLDLVGHSAFQAGSLCANLGSSIPDFGAFLNSGTFFFLDLSHLLEEGSGPQPMVLAMRPQQPPVFELSEGLITYDAGGIPTVVDPPLTIELDEFALDFYMLVDDRYVRLLRLAANVVLPIALDVNGMGEIVPLLGDLTESFGEPCEGDQTNAADGCLEVVYSELIPDSPEELASTFPLLFGIAGSFLGGAIPPIDLGQTLQGISIEDLKIRGIESDTMLGVFLALDSATTSAARRAVLTQAEIAEIRTPRTEEFYLDGDEVATVQLRVRPRSLPGNETEWSYRLDGGVWSLYYRTKTLVIADPLFRLQGRHRIEVRARDIGRPSTLDPSPEVLEFIIDSIAPELEIEPDADGVRLVATDNVSPVERIDLGIAIDGAQPAWGIQGRVDNIVGTDVELLARDEAGNITRRYFHGSVASAASGCNCDMGRSAAPGPVLFVLFLGVVVGTMRRRARS